MSDQSFRCLSLWQPWAALLVSGRKRVETRSWRIHHRGPILVHAAKKWDGELSALCVREPFKDVLESIGIFHTNPFARPPGMPFGAIVGKVEVVACFPTERVHVRDTAGQPVPPRTDGASLEISTTEQAFGDYSPNRYAFLCANPVRFAEPIPMRGCQGLFELPEDLAEQVAKRLEGR